MRVTIPDTVADTYQAIADRQGRPLDEVLTAQLQRFAACPPGERACAVNLVEVEKLLGNLPVRDGQDLLKRIADLAHLEFHGIRLDFSVGQLAELQRRADREGKSVQGLAEEIVQKINQQFFWGVGEPVAP